MKASIFIRTALIDQMQQIADLGLWFHLAKLIPSGVEVLARVNSGNAADDETVLVDLVKQFYKGFAPEYSGKYPTQKEFFSANPKTWLVSDQQGAEFHLESAPTGEGVIYVPQWFEDFKAWCDLILRGIELGELEDIEVLKTGDA